MLAGSSLGSPQRVTSTRTPALAVRASSRSRSASPGAGNSGALWRSRWPGAAAPRVSAGGRVCFVGLAQGAEHPAHLVQGLPAGRLDGPQSVTRVRGLGVDDVLAVACLDRDDAHAVRDHVVQLPRDAQPLLGDRLARRLILQPDGIPAPLPDGVTGRPGDDDAQRRPGPGRPARNPRARSAPSARRRPPG